MIGPVVFSKTWMVWIATGRACWRSPALKAGCRSRFARSEIRPPPRPVVERGRQPRQLWVQRVNDTSDKKLYGFLHPSILSEGPCLSSSSSRNGFLSLLAFSVSLVVIYVFGRRSCAESLWIEGLIMMVTFRAHSPNSFSLPRRIQRLVSWLITCGGHGIPRHNASSPALTKNCGRTYITTLCPSCARSRAPG